MASLFSRPTIIYSDHKMTPNTPNHTPKVSDLPVAIQYPTTQSDETNGDCVESDHIDRHDQVKSEQIINPFKRATVTIQVYDTALKTARMRMHKARMKLFPVLDCWQKQVKCHYEDLVQRSVNVADNHIHYVRKCRRTVVRLARLIVKGMAC
jgi:hypothetical protein